ncbi:hypothetical protein TELCIR_10496 [Teladorsagia circumcincta]|uniref:AAA+ ATPase domain-containing protein n=1 Tax=Teladorsagia circumcincta TaxID=45464 RepID=A0A2G9UBZ3_TELCI|nr:hypothetical protein TELCIR_10496 [Teladorsagia circumcincta]
MATEDVEESEPLLPKGPEDEKTLTWIDVEATVPLVGKSSKSRRKTVLRSVSGVALPREVLAIMGGSGAGKTTLMNILAFQSSKEVEILTDPTILFCDEPTTGLDGFMAHQVVQALQLMAGKGKTVVCVIHQPGSTIFNMFDSLGHQSLRVPESHNPADHVIAKLAVNNDTIEKDVKRVKFITEMFEESYAADELKELIRTTSIKPEEDDEDDQEKHNMYAVSMWTQMNILFRRAFLTTIRDPVLMQVRLLQVVITYIKGCTGLLSHGNNTVYCPSETGKGEEESQVFMNKQISLCPVGMQLLSQPDLAPSAEPQTVSPLGLIQKQMETSAQTRYGRLAGGEHAVTYILYLHVPRDRTGCPSTQSEDDLKAC